MEFKEQFKEERKNAGLTLAATAELLDISKRTIQKWSSGERTPPEHVQRLVLNTLKNNGHCPHCGKKI